MYVHDMIYMYTVYNAKYANMYIFIYIYMYKYFRSFLFLVKFDVHRNLDQIVQYFVPWARIKKICWIATMVTL